MFPELLRLAIISNTIAKKLLLDEEDKHNCSPVSNIPYLGKITEKSAINKYSGHIYHHNLDEKLTLTKST